MQTSVATIHASRAFDLPVGAVFAHWIAPETRQRWEAGPETGMRYDAFDTRPGGTETVRVLHDGAEVGHLIQTHHRIEENRLMASSMVGVFGGQPTMMTALVVEFTATDTGCRVDVVAQACDFTGRDIGAAQEAGWSWLFDRFQADLETFGPITNPKDPT